MRVLLDTHIALWAVTDAPQLPAVARGIITDPGNEVWVSAVSIRGIAICRSRPPIHSDPFDRRLVAQAQTDPFRLVTHDEVIARYSDVVMVV